MHGSSADTVAVKPAPLELGFAEDVEVELLTLVGSGVCCREADAIPV